MVNCELLIRLCLILALSYSSCVMYPSKFVIKGGNLTPKHVPIYVYQKLHVDVSVFQFKFQHEYGLH